MGKFTREKFEGLGIGARGSYTKRQKKYAVSLANTHGVRGTARALEIPPRIIRRWCRKYDKKVK